MTNSRQLSLWRRDDGQPDEDQNEQQQQQPANHSPDNVEIARCLISFYYPVFYVEEGAIVPY